MAKIKKYVVEWYEPDEEGFLKYKDKEFADQYDAHEFRDTVCIRPGVRTVKVVPVVGCCGTEVYCSGFTNTCDCCGRDFNWNGTELRPRGQWED